MATGQATDSVLDDWAPGTTVVTANNRLARTGLQAFNRRRQGGGSTLWETPDILPWSAWLRRCWEELLARAPFEPELADLAGRTLPGTVQELACWESVIADSDAGHELLQTATAAQVASEAWQLSHAWRLSVPADGPLLSDDARAFQGWARAFTRHCERHGWLDAGRLPDRLAECFASGRLAPPRRLVITGFDELTPQQQALLEAIEAAGAEVCRHTPPARRAEARRVALADQEAEVEAAARWARARLEQDPSATIGVVVPELATLRETIARIFDDTLSPGAVLPAAAAAHPPYNISLGRPFNAYPPVQAALILLELAGGAVRLEHAGALLRSPFVPGAAQEWTSRGALDARLRQWGERTVTARALRRLTREGEACAQLSAALERWSKAAEAPPRRQLPSAWAEHMLRMLGAFGWPGDRTLTSEEYQTVDKWRTLVSELAALDPVTGETDYASALSRLRRLSSDEVFQPETPAAPVQVLGVLEAAGMRFDHLWIMGLHDEVWPAAPHPNPFLPVILQRRARLPRASAERELEVARRVTDRLLSSADEVVISHPAGEGERDLRPSPLIHRLPVADPEALGIHGAPRYSELVHRTGSLESLDDRHGPALQSEGPVRGGSQVFKQQAACPFRAFAEFRLHARALESAHVGLDAAERGSLVHEVLERVWNELHDRDTLLGMSDERLGEIVDAAAGQVVEAAAREAPGVYTERFAGLERMRLVRRAREWLEVERGRGPFVVDATEKTESVTVGGVAVETKIDRIDRLPDGRAAIVDYKTGRVRVDDCFGERPEEPQLPLYSLVAGDELAAVMFAQVRPGEAGYRGVAESDDIAPGVKAEEDWRETRAEWRRVLTALGEQFRAGYAAVDPKEYPKTCTYCPLTPLCRISEMTEIGDGDDGEGSDD